MRITLKLLTAERFPDAETIDRADIPEAFVDTVDTIRALHRYGVEHACIGHTILVMADRRCVGLMLLGEAIPWDTDPERCVKCPSTASWAS